LKGIFVSLLLKTYNNGQRYDPIDLPEEYRKNGLRVKFIVKKKKGMASVRMWGKIVEVVKIEKQ
jgi:hypothetical protein